MGSRLKRVRATKVAALWTKLDQLRTRRAEKRAAAKAEREARAMAEVAANGPKQRVHRHRAFRPPSTIGGFVGGSAVQPVRRDTIAAYEAFAAQNERSRR